MPPINGIKISHQIPFPNSPSVISIKRIRPVIKYVRVKSLINLLVVNEMYWGLTALKSNIKWFNCKNYVESEGGAATTVFLPEEQMCV